MGLETVKEEIIKSAKEKSDSIIAEARSESNRIMKETEKNIREMGEKGDVETKSAIDTINKQELASSELEIKKLILDAKKQIIEKVFSEAMKKLEKMDSKKREEYIGKLLEKSKEEIEVMHIYCNKKDSKYLKEFKVETVDIIGGLIAENDEKTIRVDYSFETMLQTINDNELQGINKILFG